MSAAGSEHRRASSPADLAATSGGTKRARWSPSSESVARARASPPAENVAACTLLVPPSGSFNARKTGEESIKGEDWVWFLVSWLVRDVMFRLHYPKPVIVLYVFLLQVMPP